MVSTSSSKTAVAGSRPAAADSSNGTGVADNSNRTGVTVRISADDAKTKLPKTALPKGPIPRPKRRKTRPCSYSKNATISCALALTTPCESS